MSEQAAPLFDRTVPEPFLELLAPGGELSFVVERSIKEADLDLQLRARPTKLIGEGWATLYVGLTKALDLHFRRDGEVKAEPQRARGPAALATENGWDRWGSAGRFASEDFRSWVEQMIEAAREESRGKVDKEGAIQATVSQGKAGWFAAIDREFRLGFATRDEGIAALSAIRAPLLAVAEALHRAGEPGFGPAPGMSLKLDVLGVDTGGRVLVIEVKPGSETGALGRAPFQVAQYMALLQAWEAATPRAAEILNGMLDQRRKLGLLDPASGWKVAEPLSFVPVIAVGFPVESPVVAGRIERVTRAIGAEAPGLIDELQLWAIKAPLESSDHPISLVALEHVGPHPGETKV